MTWSHVDRRNERIEAMAARIDERAAMRAAAGEPELDILDEVIAQIADILRPGLRAQRLPRLRGEPA